MRTRIAVILMVAAVLLLSSLWQAALYPLGCAPAPPGGDGKRLQNAEVMFLTRGGLKGILTPTG